ncbi:MAG: transglutaminase-like domain-containing protein [Candidatus Micrarchaeota archaeon]|nr:transglutaminase-like domain-containing protein [Candidatus Micrarchaeota archaeon]
MQKPACVLALFLLLTLSFASSEAPQLASALSAVVDAQGTVTAIGGEIRSLNMNILVPSSASYQIVEAGEQIQFDSDGNGFLSISATDPPNPFNYSKRITVQSIARTTQSLPESYSMPSEYRSFLVPSNHTQSNDLGIRALAENITQGAKTPFEKVALLAIYVNRNMAYDDSRVGQELDAITVSKNMVGVCTEYSTIFTALARSIGIPVRYVSGYVYSDRFQSWMGHAWAEAYVGKWVPVDPTWFEVGALDAMHIEESHAAEFSKRDSLSATVSQKGVTVDWNTDKKGGAIAGNIQTQGVTYSDPSANFTFDASAKRLPFGGSAIAFLSMAGTDYRVIPVSLTSCAGTPSVALDQDEKYLVLEPGKTSTLVWEISALSSMPKGFIYSCPIALVSPYLEQRTFTISVDPTAKKVPMFDSSLRASNTLIGENNAALLQIPNERRDSTFVALLPDGLYAVRADRPSMAIPFSTNLSGRVPVFVAGGGDGYSHLAFNSGSVSSNVSIDSFSLPDLLVSGKEAVANASVSSSQYPADITLGFTFGDHYEQSVGRITGPASFEFPFTPDSPGAYSASLTASSSGSKDEEHRASTVLLQPVLAIDKVKSFYVNKTLYTQISFIKIGSPESLRASVAGLAYDASSPLTIALPLGRQAFHMSWADDAGNQYSSTEELSISQPSMMDAAVAPAKDCPLTSSLLFTVLIFSASAAGAGKPKV